MVLAFISDASHLNHFVMHPLQMRPKMRFPLKRSALTTAKVRTVKVFRNTDPVDILHVFGSRIFVKNVSLHPITSHSNFSVLTGCLAVMCFPRFVTLESQSGHRRGLSI